MTREQKITLLHELIERSVAHRGLRTDLHDLVAEISGPAPRSPLTEVCRVSGP